MISSPFMCTSRSVFLLSTTLLRGPAVYRRSNILSQELFLRSSSPMAALEMRKDFKHWEEALKLAEQLDPDQAGLICKEHAQKLEMQGGYVAARTQYRQAIIKCGQSPDSKLVRDCQAGATRSSLHLGNLREGKQMALQSGDPSLCRECAGILEGMSHLQVISRVKI